MNRTPAGLGAPSPGDERPGHWIAVTGPSRPLDATRCRWRWGENPHPLPVLLALQTTGTGSACGI